jgi:hypothetical protein
MCFISNPFTSLHDNLNTNWQFNIIMHQFFFLCVSDIMKLTPCGESDVQLLKYSLWQQFESTFPIWFSITWVKQPMLGGSLVTTAWWVLRLWMEETPSSFEGKLWIYWISSRREPTRGGPPAWGLGVGLTTHCKK